MNNGRYKLGANIRELLFDCFVVLVKFDSSPGWIKLNREALKWIRDCADAPAVTVADLLPEKERVSFLKLVEHINKQGYLASLGDSATSEDVTSPSNEGRSPNTNPTALKPKKVAYYSVSSECNLACKHCYLSAKVARQRRMGDISVSRVILNRLGDFGVTALVLTGGEPLLRSDIAEIVRLAKAKGFKTAITTNGTLLDEALAIELKEATVDDISISIESNVADIHDDLRGAGVFGRAVAAIDHLAAAGFDMEHVNICSTITRQNYRTLASMQSFAKAKGVRHSFSVFQPAGRGLRNCEDLLVDESQFRELLLSLAEASAAESMNAPGSQPPKLTEEELWRNLPLKLDLRNGCGIGGKTMCAVEEDGKVVPCHLFLGSKDHVMGNLLHEDLAGIVARHSGTWPCIDEIDACRSCNVRYFCGGFCIGGTYWGKGTANAPSPYCSALKPMYVRALETVGSKSAIQTKYTSIDCPR